MCTESQKGSPSYNDLVSRYETLYHISASKQALWKRVNDSCLVFFKSVLEKLIQAKISTQEKEGFRSLTKFHRVIIQDSTILKLPSHLFQYYTGVSNAQSCVCNVRIQGVYDLLSGKFLQFSIDPYSKNDQAAAPDMNIHPGDLSLRDRAYYSASEIKRHKDNKADCIYRHKSNGFYLDPSSGKPIRLLELLERYGTLDIEACLNNKEHTRVRLIAAPVSVEVADNRRRRAKRETKGHNPSKEILKLMGWTIFITTIPASQANFNQILKIYRLRWRIEIIFKIWKSYLHFSRIHNVSNMQFQLLMTARLIMIILLTHALYVPYYNITEYKCQRQLSMMKFINLLVNNQEKVLILLSELKHNTGCLDSICWTLARYCSTDKRRRLTLKQLENEILLS
jgi:hypothetical protein